jgi:hypothetical protein
MAGSFTTTNTLCCVSCASSWLQIVELHIMLRF